MQVIKDKFGHEYEVVTKIPRGFYLCSGLNCDQRYRKYVALWEYETKTSVVSAMNTRTMKCICVGSEEIAERINRCAGSGGGSIREAYSRLKELQQDAEYFMRNESIEEARWYDMLASNIAEGLSDLISLPWEDRGY